LVRKARTDNAAFEACSVLSRPDWGDSTFLFSLSLRCVRTPVATNNPSRGRPVHFSAPWSARPCFSPHAPFSLPPNFCGPVCVSLAPLHRVPYSTALRPWDMPAMTLQLTPVPHFAHMLIDSHSHPTATPFSRRVDPPVATISFRAGGVLTTAIFFTDLLCRCPACIPRMSCLRNFFPV